VREGLRSSKNPELQCAQVSGRRHSQLGSTVAEVGSRREATGGLQPHRVCPAWGAEDSPWMHGSLRCLRRGDVQAVGARAGIRPVDEEKSRVPAPPLGPSGRRNRTRIRERSS
jgi:hypothetical protein